MSKLYIRCQAWSRRAHAVGRRPLVPPWGDLVTHAATASSRTTTLTAMAAEPQLLSATMLANPSRMLFESRLVQVGQFRCPTLHPRFSDSGPTRAHCFVFPRTAVWIQHEGRQRFVADSTVVPLYNPGLPYRRGQISSAGDRTDWFGVTPTALQEVLALHDPQAADAERPLFRFDFARSTALTFLRQRRIFEHVRRESLPDPLFVEESVLALLDDVLATIHGRMTSAGEALPRHRALAEDARALLSATFTRGESLTAIASAVGSSAFHLCRVFRRHTGLTIHAYRGQLRLRHSLELLDDRDHDILGTALALGYSGHSHFTAAFRRAFGVTPSGYQTWSGRQRSVSREQERVSAPQHH